MINGIEHKLLNRFKWKCKINVFNFYFLNTGLSKAICELNFVNNVQVHLTTISIYNTVYAIHIHN